MSFRERAIDAAVRAMSSGRVSERHVRDILRFEDIDVSRIEPFLSSDDSMVRLMATKVVGPLGSAGELVAAAVRERDREVLVEMLGHIGARKEAVEELVGLIDSSDPVIREEAVVMFRRSGKADYLLPLLFDEDDRMVQRIKAYIDEQG